MSDTTRPPLRKLGLSKQAPSDPSEAFQDPPFFMDEDDEEAHDFAQAVAVHQARTRKDH